MKINNLYEIHFSPTGGTKETVDVISAQWNIPKSIIDLADMNVEFDKYEFYGDDLCVIGVPSFGGRVPAVAVQRIRQLKANNTPTIIIATYGNRNYDDTLVELQEIVENVGFCVVAALAVVTQHSIFPQIATGRPDALDKSKLAEMAIKIKVYIERANGFNKAKLSGENRQYKEYKGVPLKPVTSSKCMKCGICANNCPVGAIPLDNPKVTDNEKCISCMRCVRRCPKGARKISELKSSMILMKIKKECQERKDIEIFVNKNISKNIKNENVKEINETVYSNVEANMTLDGIEEISVRDFALEDAKMDKNDVGVPTIDVEKKESIVKPIKLEKQDNIVKPINAEKKDVIEKQISEEKKNVIVKQINEEKKKINVQEKIENIDKKINSMDTMVNKEQKEIDKFVQRPIENEPKPLKPKEKPKEIPKSKLPTMGLKPKEEPKEKPKPKLPTMGLKPKEEPKEIPKPKLPTMGLKPKEEPKEMPKPKLPTMGLKQKVDDEFKVEKKQEIKQENKEENILQDIADIKREVYEPEEITVPENMKNVKLSDIENNPYELDEDLLDEDEIEDILELDEIRDEYNEIQVEDPKDFILNISSELVDINVDEKNMKKPEKIEDVLGVILEDK